MPHDVSLEVKDKSGETRRVPLRSDRVLIGRVDDADVRVETRAVSRRHAELVRDPAGRWWVRDLGSRHGTFVNGKPIKERVLRTDEICELGPVQVRLRRPPPERETQGTSEVTYATDAPGEDVNTLAELEPARLGADQLATFTDLGDTLAATERRGDRLKALADFLVRKEFHALVAKVLRLSAPDAESPVEIVVASAPPDAEEAAADHVSRAVLRAVLEKRAPILGTATSRGSGIDMTQIPATRGTAAIACPLSVDGNTHEILYVVVPAGYGSAEWLALISLAAKEYQRAEALWKARAEAEAHAAIEQDLARARQIQLSLVPDRVELSGFDVALDFEPSAVVGGDYVDAAPMPDGRTLFVVADVTGHGLPAALIAQSLQSMVRLCLRSRLGVEETFTALNDHFREHLDWRTFVTVVAMALDPTSGDFELVNAGHPPPLVTDADGTWRTLPSAEYFPLGILPQSFSPHRDRLEAGQLGMLYSDGLIEVPDEDGTLLWVEGLAERLGRFFRPERPAREVADNLTAMLRHLDGDRLQPDDRSFLLIKRELDTDERAGLSAAGACGNVGGGSPAEKHP